MLFFIERVPLRRIVKNAMPSRIRLLLWKSASPLAQWKLMDPLTMDDYLLDMQITHQGHRLDKATKERWSANRAAYYTNNKALLQLALEACRVKGRTGEHISWAETVIARYQQWEKNRKEILEPPTPERMGQNGNIYDLIRSRRSVRYFRAADVEREKIELILEAGRWAPCSGNRQAWHFAVQKVGKSARDVESKADSDNQVRPYGAAVLYIAIDERLYPWKYAAAMDAAAAIQNMLLMAHHLGLGACWYYGAERLNQDKLRARLGFSDHCYIYSTIQLGYPVEAPDAPGRKPLDKIATFIGFDTTGE